MGDAGRLVVWLLLWKGTFGFIEKGVALLGLVTLCFVVAAVMLRPDWKAVAAGGAEPAAA